MTAPRCPQISWATWKSTHTVRSTKFAQSLSTAWGPGFDQQPVQQRLRDKPILLRVKSAENCQELFFTARHCSVGMLGGRGLDTAAGQARNKLSMQPRIQKVFWFMMRASESVQAVYVSSDDEAGNKVQKQVRSIASNSLSAHRPQFKKELQSRLKSQQHRGFPAIKPFLHISIYIFAHVYISQDARTRFLGNLNLQPVYPHTPEEHPSHPHSILGFEVANIPFKKRICNY